METALNTTFTLSFEGNDADDHEIDFYDVSHALMGFQRSLAITTHLVLNGTVITQAPSLKGARIVALPPEEGSWKVIAAISLIGGGVYTLGTTPQDTPIGHLVYSAYDYVISEMLGAHVDYDKSLGKMYEEMKEREVKSLPILEQSQFDSVIEKTEYAIKDMHRPIVKSETADKARIIASTRGHEKPIEQPLNHGTFEYIAHTEQSKDSEKVTGRVSSYNMNTFKGRIFIEEERRPISFTLADTARNFQCINLLTQSLSMNAVDRMNTGGDVECVVYKAYSRSGRLKSLLIMDVEKAR